jgi:uncharacterized protein YdeI (YjbR/CyaY-like superfamily)
VANPHPSSDPPTPAIFASAADFRRWLEVHHDSETELWVGYYKKSVPKTSITYPQAVEEALCFGWIDGITRRFDDEVYANRFTPRRRTSIWSAINIAKIGELTAAGRMHPAGLRAFEDRDRRKDASYSYSRQPQELPPDLVARFEADEAAWEFWQSRPPGIRRQATHWVMSAKRPETRERRFTTLVGDARERHLPAPFLVTRDQRSSQPKEADR